MPESYAFERHPGIDLRGVDLAAAMLIEAELPGANLDGVRACDVFGGGIVLTGASMKGANFVKAQLVESDFSDATADGARFNRADLREARFDRASLRGATFVRAYLKDASFVGADVTDADFDGAILSGAALSADAVTDDMDCRLFVDGLGDRAALTERVRDWLDLTADEHWLTGQGVTLVVDANDYALDGGDKDDPERGFMSYDLSVECSFAADVGLALRVGVIGRLMRVIRVAGGRVVAACDYEDALP